MSEPACRTCSTPLVSGSTWHPSRAERNNRLCIECTKRETAAWKATNKAAVKGQKGRAAVRFAQSHPGQTKARIKMLRQMADWLESLLEDNARES